MFWEGKSDLVHLDAVRAHFMSVLIPSALERDFCLQHFVKWHSEAPEPSGTKQPTQTRKQETLSGAGGGEKERMMEDWEWRETREVKQTVNSQKDGSESWRTEKLRAEGCSRHSWPSRPGQETTERRSLSLKCLSEQQCAGCHSAAVWAKLEEGPDRKKETKLHAAFLTEATTEVETNIYSWEQKHPQEKNIEKVLCM